MKTVFLNKVKTLPRIQGGGKRLHVVAKAEGLSPLEVLRQENELLRQTIADAEAAVGTLENDLKGQGLAPNSVMPRDMDDPVEIWSPSVVVPDGHEMVEAYGQIAPVSSHDGTEVLKWDQTLWSHADHFRFRFSQFRNVRQQIDSNEGGLEKFSQAYKYFGLNRGAHEGKAGVWYREWAPAARALCLVGDFNEWKPKDDHWAFRNQFGVWELFLPDGPDGTPAIPHRSVLKCRLEDCDGKWVDRIPAYIKWATQKWDEVQYNGCHWEPPLGKGKPGVLAEGYTYTFKYPRPARPRAMRIYEAHVGMSSEDPKVSTYNEFREKVLPRVRKLGYNAIQLMAIQEHAYYGSFGYHVTNFFAPSSRSGTPDELKALIDEAHRMGIMVLMDIVHSHASKNAQDGLNLFDGTDHMYFHSGARGYHWVWDSRCFNYGNWESLRFLLSNARYWMEEFKFDGYRFDGVTSMMYHHHGLGFSFTGNYNEYFGYATDVDAIVYMMLVNDMLHGLYPQSVMVGEDVSGMPTFCRPTSEGGIGFDYRLHMAVPDMWIEYMKIRDEDWGMGHITHTLGNRRYMEEVISYAESHDQALVGDKTIAFWLMDKDMYDCMAAPGHGGTSAAVDRGMSLHKMIRAATMALGGAGYLNFMGNEFGHPEWIDFPRDDFVDPSTGRFIKGNGGSFHHCRRRWDLADSSILKYQFLNNFDRALMHLDKAFGFLSAPHSYISRKDEGDKVIVVERGDLVFVFNFHPYKSFTDYRVGCLNPGPYKIALSSDEKIFYGWENATKWSNVEFPTFGGNHDNRPHSFNVYAPSRTVVVYAPAAWCDKDNETVPGLAVRGLGPYPGA